MDITHDEFCELERIAMDVGIEDVRADYSGRGMLGRTCFGIVIGDPMELAEFLIEAAIDGEGVSEIVQYMRDHKPSRDNMAFDTILYWERLRVPGQDES